MADVQTRERSHTLEGKLPHGLCVHSMSLVKKNKHISDDTICCC